MGLKKSVIIIMCIIVGVIFFVSLQKDCNSCGTGEKDIEIVSEGFGYSDMGSDAVVVKIKNTSSSTIKVSFEVNIYKDGVMIDTTVSGVATVGAGETAKLDAVFWRGSPYAKYTYKITRWNFY